MSDPIQYENKDDRWFDWKGVKKPERTPHGIQDKPDSAVSDLLKKNLEGHVCEWVHNGGEIYCVAGGFRHGRRIGPKQTIKDGKLVKLQPQYRR